MECLFSSFWSLLYDQYFVQSQNSFKIDYHIENYKNHWSLLYFTIIIVFHHISPINPNRKKTHFTMSPLDLTLDESFKSVNGFLVMENNVFHITKARAKDYPLVNFLT